MANFIDDMFLELNQDLEKLIEQARKLNRNKRSK